MSVEKVFENIIDAGKNDSDVCVMQVVPGLAPVDMLTNQRETYYPQLDRIRLSLSLKKRLSMRRKTKSPIRSSITL